MLNDIRLHLDADDSQRQHETVLAQTITRLESKNINAFKRYIPSIAEIIPRLPATSLSLFVDKNQHTNLVEVNTGRTFYHLSVDDNIATQTNAWGLNSALLCLQASDKPPLPMIQNKPQGFSYISNNNFASVQQYGSEIQQTCTHLTPDTLVCMGLGKGLHLPELMNTFTPKYLVVYEPNWEIFRVSLNLFNWADFLAQATNNNVQIFLQFGHQDQSVFDDINDLYAQTGAKRIVFFEHDKTPTSSQLLHNIRMGKWGVSLTELAQASADHAQHYLNAICALDYENWHNVNTTHTLFLSNMQLFAEHFPDIHAVFVDYQPTCWEVIKHRKTGDVNLFNHQHNSLFSHGTPAHDGKVMAANFIQHPNLDGLVFGYSGDKLKHYLHNTFISQADKVLASLPDDKGELPEAVKVLLVFGLGQGYMLDSLYQQKDIQNLIICEPNPDFFYAALHAINWAPIFEKVQEKEYKLYINIGEASSRLFKDLMSQFLALGPYLLNETYIMQAYENPLLRGVLSEVRTQLKVIFAMGENFDHVVYGIGHTFQCLQNKASFLRSNPSQYLSQKQRQLPVIVVGNGPSLDANIDIIKEYRQQVIVVSCGTALQALHSNNIVPDFHGEVEQNRANFDWVSRINDYAYLKQITLLSVNGMHPDTIALFKNVLLAFKHGESSSAATLAMLPAQSYHELEYAYPTVSNMVLSLFLSLGFEQLYLVGIDLGFADQSKHHSEASGYYENGKQIFDYQSTHHTNIRVKGNKRDYVFTKTEFTISRMIIEQLLLNHKAECFNLSDGAFIGGSVSLHHDAVLIMTSEDDKNATLTAMDNCFMALASDLKPMFAKSYSPTKLGEQIQQLRELAQTNFQSNGEIDDFIEAQRALLMSAKKAGGSLFYYYFFNSINYLCAALGKANMHKDAQEGLPVANYIIENWRRFVQDSEHLIKHQFEILDVAEAFSEKRERHLLAAKQTLNYICFDRTLYAVVDDLLSQHSQYAMHISEHIHIGNSGNYLIDIVNNDDLTKVIEYFDAKGFDTNKHAHNNLGLVVHNSTLLKQVRASKVLAQCCLLYMPCMQNVQNISLTDTTNAALQQSGEQAYLEPIDYIHHIVARGQDLNLFKEIIVKPRFCKTGLKNAKDSIVVVPSDKKEQSDEITPLLPVPNNEYTSLAMQCIEQDILPGLALHTHYMFKHYVALSRDQARNNKHTSMTIVDGLCNRGLLVPRQVFAFELLGAWYNK